jgi:CopG family transcriptional regulator, nickel-responsive regulator
MTPSKEENTIRFSVSLPQTLLETLDHQVSQQGYSSRSEFIRDLIREKIIEDEWKDQTNEVFGVLTLTYDHHQRELAQKIMDIQHDSYVHVLCTTHIHLCHDLCLETIIIKGNPREIETLSGEISGLRGVRAAKLTKTAKLSS